MSKAIPAFIALALLAVLALEWLGWSAKNHAPEVSIPQTDNAPSGDTEALGRKLLARLDAAEPKDRYISIVEHPLFQPDRKPESDEEETQPPDPMEGAAQELDVLDLTAVLISPNVVSAWVKEPGKPKAKRLRIGDDLMGWSVQQILDDRVVLERQGEEDTLILRDYSKSPPAAPPAAVRVPAQGRSPRSQRPPTPTQNPH